MTRRMVASFSVVMLGALLLAFGVWRGEADVVFKKAVVVCLECIGIG